MNETIENIMIFINENTNILIGICLFLIFVLVCYLIDNSIKSRKAKKEFKKSQMVQKQIMKNETKPEIKIEKEVKIEPEIKEDKNETAELVEQNLFEEAINTSDDNISIEKEEVETDMDVPTDNLFESAVMDNNKNNFDFENSNLDEVINIIESKDIVDESVKETEAKEETTEETAEADVLYKNDKKLSEILFTDAKKEEQGQTANFDEISNNEVESNIFDDTSKVSEEIQPKNVEPKVEIELNEDELDNIMKKLKNITSIEDDDNYTNIF